MHPVGVVVQITCYLSQQNLALAENKIQRKEWLRDV
jgi:hypothetical protein